MLRWNSDVEHVDVMLGHNVEYTGSMSRLSILVLECSKGNLSTRTRGFCMPVHGAGGPRGCHHVEMIGLEAGIVP